MTIKTQQKALTRFAEDIENADKNAKARGIINGMQPWLFFGVKGKRVVSILTRYYPEGEMPGIEEYEDNYCGHPFHKVAC